MHQSNDFKLSCPYCGETINVFIDESAGSQTYYEDCTVCCAPILFIITETTSGELEVITQRDDD